MFEDDIEVKRMFSADQRREMADAGEALPDGSFPIESKSDLKNAIQAHGRASNKAAAKKHIKARAKALGAVAGFHAGRVEALLAEARQDLAAFAEARRFWT